MHGPAAVRVSRPSSLTTVTAYCLQQLAVWGEPGNGRTHSSSNWAYECHEEAAGMSPSRARYGRPVSADAIGGSWSDQIGVVDPLGTGGVRAR